MVCLLLLDRCELVFCTSLDGAVVVDVEVLWMRWLRCCMAKVICFKHSYYDGKDCPELSCKVCCSLYINSIREKKKAKIKLSKTKKSLKKATN